MLACRPSGVCFYIKIVIRKPGTGTPAGQQPYWKMLGCRSSGVWLLMQMLLGAKHREINRPAAKLKNVGLQVFWCLFYIKNVTSKPGTGRPADQHPNWKMLACWWSSDALCQKIWKQLRHPQNSPKKYRNSWDIRFFGVWRAKTHDKI